MFTVVPDQRLLPFKDFKPLILGTVRISLLTQNIHFAHLLIGIKMILALSGALYVTICTKTLLQAMPHCISITVSTKLKAAPTTYKAHLTHATISGVSSESVFS